METMATVLLQLTASPLLRDSLLPRKTDIKNALYPLNPKLPALAKFLKRRAEGQVDWPLPVMGKEEAEEADLELWRAVEQRLAQRRLNAAFEGLLEHISGLRGKIAKWEEVEAGYKESWGQLQQHAASLNVPPDLIEPSVRLALKRIPALGEGEGLPWFREQKVTTSGQEHFTNILLQRPASRRLLQVFSQKLGELNAAYDELEEMLSPPSLDNALVTGHCKYCPVP
jgi:hypothetical protein